MAAASHRRSFSSSHKDPSDGGIGGKLGWALPQLPPPCTLLSCHHLKLVHDRSLSKTTSTNPQMACLLKHAQSRSSPSMGPSPLSNLSIHSRLLSCVASDPAQIPSAIILITFAQTLSSLVPLYLHPPGTNLSLRECNSPPSSHTSDGRALQEKTPEATRWFHHEPSHLLNNAISSQTPM